MVPQPGALLTGPGTGLSEHDASMTPRRLAHGLAPALLLGFLLAACGNWPAATPRSSVVTLCGSQATTVSGGYALQNNEWRSTARECITTNGNAEFTVTESTITNSGGGGVGGYPSLYKGCHWASCTSGSGLPIQVASIRAGTVTTSWSTVQPAGSGIWNAAYDIWISKTPAFHGHPTGAELMIWLSHAGPVRPAGHEAASNVNIDGRCYNVWVGRRTSWIDISYELTEVATSVSNLDLQPLLADALGRGYLQASWYLTGVEAGFEIWQGGKGLATRSFSVNVAGS